MTNLQQTAQDCGRSVRVELSNSEIRNARAIEEIRAISGLVDSLLRDNLGDRVDRNLFCAKEFLDQAIREAK